MPLGSNSQFESGVAIVADSPPTYGRAIWDSWCNDAKLAAIDATKILRSAAFGVVAGLIIAQQTGKMDTAANIALTTAIVTGASLAVMMIAHVTWSWATAPRRVFRSQQKDIVALRADLGTANDEIKLLKSPKSRRAELGDVKDCLVELHRTSYGRKFTQKQEFQDWFQNIVAKLRIILRQTKCDEFESAPYTYTDGAMSGTKDGVQKAYEVCMRWLSLNAGQVRDEHINPTFRVPA
jgi:hypothetical protein